MADRREKVVAGAGRDGQMPGRAGKIIGGGWRACLALAFLLALLPTPLAAEASQPAPSEVVFLAEIIVLLVCGRLLGEAMQRIGQPAVMGQLLAGVLLGPSVFGALSPGLQHALFPGTPGQSGMIGAVGQLGILMLLLLTGMETDLSLIRKTRRAAFSVSLAGIAVPFLCGVVVGELLPDSMLPNPDHRLVTTLFLGTALAISSVKIVAMAVREMDFMRRTLGQVIVAAAIIDDTLGWIILAIILGLAQHGTIELGSLAQSVFGTLLFLLASFTIGRRLVFLLIRWANDNLVSDVPVITTILVVMGVMALITHAIGVHTVLGAFVAGILVGQSPILTRHIDEQLRGLITALFMPVFFGLAGLSANLDVLADPAMLLLSLGLILIASIGKFSGAFLGGLFGGFAWRESFALGWGMNARGSTEIIVATIGLATGALSQTLFTMILTMAVVTTMAMPPMLRWSLARVPMRPDEEARLEREAFEAEGFVTTMERLLVAVDENANGRFASRLAGLVAGSRRIPMTILRVAPDVPPRRTRAAAPPPAQVEAVAKATAETAKPDNPEPDVAPKPVDITMRSEERPFEEAVADEAKKGYDLLVVGVEPAAVEGVFDDKVARIAAEFKGPFAVAEARGSHRRAEIGRALDILVPVTGTDYSRRGAEVALALALADHGSVTALYVAAPSRRPWRRQLRAAWAIAADEGAILRDIVALGDRMDVEVRTAVHAGTDAADAILRQLKAGRHNLVVMGVSARSGPTLFFGAVPAAVLAQSDRSVLFVSSGGQLAEAPAAAPPKAPSGAGANAALAGTPGRAAS
jgi:Kef-type K+ transport system membrane component KefB/nucleotide-binding universal stress UspA family protein